MNEGKIKTIMINRYKGQIRVGQSGPIVVGNLPPEQSPIVQQKPPIVQKPPIAQKSAVTHMDVKNHVTDVYRKILKREPDPKGFKHYVSQISSGKISKKRFLEILRTSKEYKRNLKSVRIDENKDNSITFFVFIGEFGYEILSSHGWLRLLKSKYPDFKIGVASRGGVEFLYEDCCDIYVDITDILSKYISQGFQVIGFDISKKDKEEIYRRCSDMCKGYTIHMAYSNQKYCDNGIEYGIVRKEDLIRNPHHIYKQKFKLLTLSKFEEEKRYIFEKFPELSKKRYVVLHDRRRDISWGQKEVDKDTWKYIIGRLIQAGYLVVLIGYKPYKDKDSYSIFYKDEFKNMSGTINLSDFLDTHINNNILYQALVVQRAEFFLGIWGSVGYIPPLLGVNSYLLTIGRKQFDHIKKDAGLWDKLLSVEKGHIYCLESTTERESITNVLEKKIYFKKKLIDVKIC